MGSQKGDCGACWLQHLLNVLESDGFKDGPLFRQIITSADGSDTSSTRPMKMDELITEIRYYNVWAS